MLSSRLLRWYQKNARALPWRETRDPYKIWISEVMLQQTTVKAVIPYYLRWIKTFPTVCHLARASRQKVLRLWQGLGYYARAKNLHKSSQILVKDFSGKIPQVFEQLRALPGFGPYTTGAVLSIAFNKKHPIIDANVRRVVMRLLAIEGFADTKNDEDIFKYLQKILPNKQVGDFNQALMELGAVVCRSREPLCGSCPVRQHCYAFQKGIQEIIPKPKKSVIKDVRAVIAVIKRNGKYLIQKRPSSGLLADLWEFPGGKIEKKESAKAALVREVKEELGADVLTSRFLFDVIHYYTQFRVKLFVFDCQVKGRIKFHRFQRWVSPKSLSQFPMPSGSARILSKIIDYNIH